MVTIGELHDECERLVVGPLIYTELENAVARSYVRLAGRLTRDGFDEEESMSAAMTYLVLEPASGAMAPIRELLIRDYSEMRAAGTPMTLGAFRAALKTTVYRFLLTLHPRGYVENLVDRAVEDLAREPYVRVAWAGSYRYFRRDTYRPGDEDATLPHKDHISRAVVEAMPIEKLPQRRLNSSDDNPYADVRLSKVYGAAEFSAVLKILTDNADGLSKAQIYEFFQELLTFYRDTTLQPSMNEGGGSSSMEDQIEQELSHSDIDAIRATLAAEATWNELSPSQRVIFRMKAEGVTDLAIAKSPLLASHNGGSKVSRVTVLNMRTAMQEVVRVGLADLPEHEQTFAWNLLLGKAYSDGN